MKKHPIIYSSEARGDTLNRGVRFAADPALLDDEPVGSELPINGRVAFTIDDGSRVYESCRMPVRRLLLSEPKGNA